MDNPFVSSPADNEHLYFAKEIEKKNSDTGKFSKQIF